MIRNFFFTVYKKLYHRIPYFVIVVGGLGNQLFIAATAIELAKRNCKKIYFISTWYRSKQRGDKYLGHERNYILDSFPQLKQKKYIFKKWFELFIYFIYLTALKFKYQYIVKNVDENNYVKFDSSVFIIYGYMQNPQFFLKNRENLLNIFNFASIKNSKLRDLLLLYKGDSSLMVALHVRRGDNLINPTSQNLLTPNYYLKCLKILDVPKENERILVFSDDISWCKENLKLSKVIYVEESDPFASLFLMKSCDYFVLAPSTFSWWGAFLSDSPIKKVLAPFPYVELNFETWKQFYLDDWVKVQSEFYGSKID